MSTKTLSPTFLSQVHLAEKASFTIFKDLLITVGDDSALKVFRLPCDPSMAGDDDPIEDTLKEIQTKEFDQELHAIASNQVDLIAYGGKEKKVMLQKLTYHQNDDQVKFEGNPELAMTTESPITKLKFVSGQYLLAVSEDKTCQLMDMETKQVKWFHSGAHKCSVRNAAVDPKLEFLTTMGCDGTLIMNKIENQEKVKDEQQIAGKTTMSSNQYMDLLWSPDGSKLYIAGNKKVYVQTRLPSSEDPEQMEHDKEVSLLTMPQNDILITYALDNKVRVWLLQGKPVCTHVIKLDQPLIALDYCKKNEVIAMMSKDCSIGFSKLSLDDVKQLPVEPQVEDQIDLEDIDMDDLADNIQQEEEQNKPEPKLDEKPQTEQLDKQEELKPHKPQQNFQQATIVQAPRQGYVLDVSPQETFVPNCVYDYEQQNVRILSWNTVGIVSIRKDFQHNQIDVDFMNKQFHRNLVLPDSFMIQMSALNYSGMVTASRAHEQDEDAYEDDDQSQLSQQVDKRVKSSNIEYRPFNEWKKTKVWNFELKNSESVECLAIGSGWCTAYTNYNYIRVFSADGIQKTILCTGTPVVSMAGYENQLAVVYHGGPAFDGCQSLKVKLISMANRDYRVIVETDCPLSRHGELKWLGFSEEGQLMTFDSEGVMRAFNTVSSQWMPVFDFKIKHLEISGNIWIVGVMESEILAIVVQNDAPVPFLSQKSQIRRFGFNPQFLQQESDLESKEQTLSQIECQIYTKQMVIDHELYRRDNWETLKQFRSKYDNEYCISESILDVQDINAMKKEVDKMLLNAVRMCIMKQETEKVFSYMDMMYFNQSLKLCVQLCEKMKASQIAEKVEKFIVTKESKDKFQASQQQAIAQKSGTSTNQMQGNNLSSNRVMPPTSQNPAQINFAAKLASEKPDLDLYKPVNVVVTTKKDENPEPVVVTQTAPATNPFSKAATSTQVEKSGSNGDVFADLKSQQVNETQKSAAEMTGLKRKNPFQKAQTTNAGLPAKQRKLK